MAVSHRERQLRKILARLFTSIPEASIWFRRQCDNARLAEFCDLQSPSFEPFHRFPHPQPWNEKHRENDLLVTFRDSRRSKVFGLCEVKIDAPFGYEQAADYKKRAAWLVECGQCSCAFTVLIAPRSYFRHPLARVFEVRVELESVANHLADWFRVDQADADFIRAACTHVYVQVPDEVNSVFWSKYASLQLAEFPRLFITNFPQDGRGKGGSAIDPYFKGAVDQWPIKHSWRNATVMIELLRRRYLEPFVRSQLLPKFDHDWRLELPRSGRKQSDGTRGTSLHISVAAPTVYPDRPFESQVREVRAGLKCADAFYEWELTNAHILDDLNATRKR